VVFLIRVEKVERVGRTKWSGKYELGGERRDVCKTSKAKEGQSRKMKGRRHNRV
jgi:hypothetical protein